MQLREDRMIHIIGAGLAGCETAWQIANRGIKVRLYEMKPGKKSPAHELDTLAELVCSNSLKANNVESASGLLKEEMRILGSLIVEAADNTQVPAGGSLAVDRKQFSNYITDKIRTHPNIQVVHEEVKETKETKEGITVIATGPLTSDALAQKIGKLTGEQLFFYDAASPIIETDSINMDVAFKGSRYNKGDDYINCPMTEDQYNAFYERLLCAETAEIHGFEDKKVFESCMPIENIARRGKMTMAFGPLKPVGIYDPRSERRPFAVVQLRQDNAMGTMYNMVGFQTRLKFHEQKEVFRMIPGLEKVNFLRYGVMHKNTYINSPTLLNADCSMKKNKDIYFAGQIMGVEGYVESAACGLWVGISIANRVQNKTQIILSNQTMLGALLGYCTDNDIESLQPMNANYGIISPLEKRVRGKKARREEYSKRAIIKVKELKKDIERV
ncbi:MAG: methylenetetrahydrofolate--tRNA-(uracil(54)-C(5))-methyltransferase (FADH(2)-oxidizing) TrmFO [Clostridiales bacterium]|nr:methylenetetrahydrofolate--tRNA-(uracil(54)-C(5))-methyltransferase (FADH(2)-oxidizing) TrmFO [Clostridiales bacterium]